MTVVALVDAGEELLDLRPKGAEGGETNWDEVEAMGPARVSMLVTLTFLNICESRGSVSPTTTGG